MAASNRGGGQRSRSKVKLCFERVGGDEEVRRTMGVRKVMLQGEFSMKKSVQMPGFHIFLQHVLVKKISPGLIFKSLKSQHRSISNSGLLRPREIPDLPGFSLHLCSTGGAAVRDTRNVPLHSLTHLVPSLTASVGHSLAPCSTHKLCREYCILPCWPSGIQTF